MCIDNYDILITKFLSEEISNDEMIKLKEWLNDSHENQLYFNKMKEAWKLSNLEPDFKTSQPPNLDEIYKKGNTNYIYQVLKIAAVVAIPLIFSFFLFPNNNTDNERYFMSSTDKMKIVSLIDSSKIWLNKSSNISYLINDDKRNVIMKGEVFFDIEAMSNVPFYVSCDNAKIKVLGTSFNIKENKEFVEVYLLTGKIVIAPNSASERILKEGEKAIINKKTGEIKSVVHESIPQLEWRKINLSFKDESLQTISERLSSFYGVDIKFRNRKISDCRFTADLTGKTLASIFQLLHISNGIEVSELPNHIFYLDKGNCN